MPERNLRDGERTSHSGKIDGPGIYGRDILELRDGRAAVRKYTQHSRPVVTIVNVFKPHSRVAHLPSLVSSTSCTGGVLRITAASHGRAASLLLRHTLDFAAVHQSRCA